MAKKTAVRIEEIGGRTQQFAAAEVRQKVMKGSEQGTASSDTNKLALWSKARCH